MNIDAAVNYSFGFYLHNFETNHVRYSTLMSPLFALEAETPLRIGLSWSQ